jgi:peptidoglycan/LPS O-acetylase OafA/YrhL
MSDNGMPANGPTARAPGRSLNEKIDLCRGLFAFLVVSAHALEMAWAIDPAGPRALSPWAHHFLAHVTGTGLYYVMGFFVISGYCIQLSVQRLGRGGSFPLRAYLMARLTRILPLYYLALMTTVLLEQALAGMRAPVWSNGLSRSVLLCQLVVIQNFTQTYGSFAPSWSITNEVVYYMLFGLLAATFAGNRTRPVVAGTAACLGVGVLCQIIYRSGYHHPIILSTGLLFGLGINWFAGVLVALSSDRLASFRPLRWAARGWPLVLALTMLLWCSQRVHLEFVYLGAGLAFTLMLIRFVIAEADAGTPAPRRPGRFATLLGLSSYPTYLFHGPILLLIGSLLRDSSPSRPWWLVWPLAATIAIAAGVLLGLVAERPIMAWRAGYLKRLREARPAGSRGGAAAPILSIQQ